MVVIREKTVVDEDGVAEIVALATKDLRRAYAPTPRADRMATLNEKNGSLSLVAIAGNFVAGVVEYCVRYDEIYIQGLAVHPQQRQRGIASALIRTIERIAINFGKSKVSLSTIKETGNLTFFVKLGFNVVSETPAEGFLGADGHQVTKVNMCRIPTTTASAIEFADDARQQEA